MDIDAEERKRQLAYFRSFIEQSYSRIDEVLEGVGWTREYLEKEKTEIVLCPLNAEHTMPKRCLDAHVMSCAWRKEGYDKLDIPLPENSTVDPESTKSTFVLDASLQAAIIKEAKKEDPLLLTGNLETHERLVPKTSDRLVADFTVDERRILYDCIVSKTTPVEDVKVEELQMIGDVKRNEEQRPKSQLELLIEERDAKRRRISYRKKVHTNRKSHTEVMREVIQNQMELLEQIMTDKSVEDRDEKCSVNNAKQKICEESFKKSHVSNDDFDKNSINKRPVDERKKRNYWEQAKYYSGDSTDLATHSKRNIDYDKMQSEQSRLYDRDDGNSNGKRIKGWIEKRKPVECNMESTSFENKYSGERHHYDNDKNWEKARDHRYYSRMKESNYNHQAKRLRDESETYSESKYCKNSSKYKSVNQVEYEKEYYSHSKHCRNTNLSKHCSIEHDVDYERDYYSHSRHKSWSKHDNAEYFMEYEKEYTNTKSHRSTFSAYDDHDGEFRDNYDSKAKRSKRLVENSYYDNKLYAALEGRRSQHSDESVNGRDSHKREETSFDSQKNIEESKGMKKKKKKHKHKLKKKSHKKKRYSSSSSSSSKSPSESDTS